MKLYQPPARSAQHLLRRNEGISEPRDMRRLSPFLRLFFDQLIAQNTDVTPEEDDTLTVPGLLLMNEFMRLGHMLDLVESAQYLRGYGMRLALVVQSKAQFRAKYGDDVTEDLFSNLGAEVVFGTADLKLTKELEERLGDNTVLTSTRNTPSYWPSFKPGKQSDTERRDRRPLMYDQEIALLPRTRQLILRPGMRPMLTDRIHAPTDRAFMGLEYPPPQIPKLKVDTVFDDGKGPVVRARPKMEVTMAQSVAPGALLLSVPRP